MIARVGDIVTIGDAGSWEVIDIDKDGDLIIRQPPRSRESQPKYGNQSWCEPADVTAIEYRPTVDASWICNLCVRPAEGSERFETCQKDGCTGGIQPNL